MVVNHFGPLQEQKVTKKCPPSFLPFSHHFFINMWHTAAPIKTKFGVHIFRQLQHIFWFWKIPNGYHGRHLEIDLILLYLHKYWCLEPPYVLTTYRKSHMSIHLFGYGFSLVGIMNYLVLRQYVKLLWQLLIRRHFVWHWPFWCQNDIFHAR